jgi:hypothetical protein
MGLWFRDATLVEVKPPWWKPSRLFRNEPCEPQQAERALPVQSGEIPGWLQRRMDRCGDDVLYRGPMDSDPRWLDHWGTSRDARGHEVFVSEPYHLDTEKLRRVLAFCERYDLEVEVKGSSDWFPTKAIRLEFRPQRVVDGQEGGQG